MAVTNELANRQATRRSKNRDVLQSALEKMAGIMSDLAFLLEQNSVSNLNPDDIDNVIQSAIVHAKAPRRQTVTVSPTPKLDAAMGARKVIAATVAKAPTTQAATRRSGAGEAIMSALLRPTGILASELKTYAKYATSAAYLNRLAQVHDFTWWTSHEGDAVKYRFHANPNNKATRKRA